MSPRSAWSSEFREVVWLASVVSGLSVLGVSIAVGWRSRSITGQPSFLTHDHRADEG
jgi:hypothetical protein